jgi:methyltransferase (TIGR00027 family)
VVLLGKSSVIVRGVETTNLPSQTALFAAAARAAHLIVDREPVIFADELAAILLGEQAEEFISYHRLHGTHLVLSGARAQAVCRSRFTEDHLAAGVRDGVSQYVILGAGLDSFGYRPQPATGGPAGRGLIRVFEVDHPASQQWKRGHLAAAGIPVPDHVSFVPMDFERDPLAGRLRQAGFDPERPALVSWLGVTMYLTQAAISQTLAELGTFAPGTQLITDYMLPAGLRDETGNTYADLVAPTAAERGEPWLTFLAPDDMSALLERHGFGAIEHVRQRDSVPAALWDRTDALRPAALSVLARATVSRRSSP